MQKHTWNASWFQGSRKLFVTKLNQIKAPHIHIHPEYDKGQNIKQQ